MKTQRKRCGTFQAKMVTKKVLLSKKLSAWKSFPQFNSNASDSIQNVDSKQDIIERTFDFVVWEACLVDVIYCLHILRGVTIFKCWSIFLIYNLIALQGLDTDDSEGCEFQQSLEPKVV